MEPILQRFGDVTIQRLEKPKAPANKEPVKEEPSKEEPKDEDSLSSHSETEPIDEIASLKRSFPDSQISIKRFKFDANTPEKKATVQTTPKPLISDDSKLSDDFLNNFSDGEFSDFDSESEMESEPDFPELSSKSEDESTSPSFLDKFVSEPAPPPPESSSNPPETRVKTENAENTEDYDFDIKEKLKEMGEISFQTVKKSEIKPKKVEVATENEVVVTPAKKSGSTDEEGLKGLPLRRNIREVMDETKLDESTLAAQRQEMERLARVQEQQRLLRELQRQAAQERMQHKVMSLLQGNNNTFSKPGTSTTRIGNTVLVKLPNGQTKPMTRLPKKPLEMVSMQKNAGPVLPAFNRQSNKSPVAMRRPGANLTPSVSIAPVAKKPAMPTPRLYSDESDSEEEDESKLAPKVKDEPPTPVVPTIDISSDEDCIVVSEPEEPDEPEDDPSNSGMHTNDEFNQPDDQGRVVVNIAHPDDEPDIFIAPQISRIVKPHQIGGIRFLYDNVIESTTRFDNSTGFGCILAHSMGLGKTLQIVCFSDIFLRHTSATTILCIMPINTLQNWMAEYNMWLPHEDNIATSPLMNHGEVRPRNFNLHVLNDSHKTLTARHKVIHQWRSAGGVLLIGYEQFRLLSMRKHPKSRRKQPINEAPEDDKNKRMFDEVHEALVKPGPDLVICDEGHRIKNSHASISLALKQMRTKRRIVLTGYPLQNNLMEYWCMVDFVRPNYLGTKTEFCNMFERPIMNGQCIDSTENDIKLMRYRAHVLHSLLVGFVQRRSHAVLQTALPQKEEYVLLVRMTPFQRKLYDVFMDEVVRSQTVPNPLKAFAVCCKIWNHPDVLYNFLKKRARGDAVDIDLEEVASTAVGSEPAKPKKTAAKPRKNAAKGKNGAKPAASITPYTTNPESNPPNPTGLLDANALNPPLEISQNSSNNSIQQQPINSNKSENSVAATNPFQQNYFESSNNSSTFGNFGLDSAQFGSDFNNYHQQNYWNQPFNQSNDWTQQQQSSQPQHLFNPNATNPNSNQSWLKCDENSSKFSVKSENSNDSKPKINIISDIKLPPVFSPADKKIKILSDIKLEPKLEEIDSKQEIKPEIKKMIKDEIKNEALLRNEEELGAAQNELAKLTPARDLKEDSGIPYDWAIELLKDYIPGCIENSGKMEILFCIIRESIALGDRLLVFSQSLITLDLIEQFLHMNFVPGDTVKWARNVSYYRLDGSTSALEREKLINEFNSNPKIHLFLVSTRAGSLGINLIGANRVVVLDASWNPCHDTQAVCRVYRYGQRKPCFVYRLVVDNCLEKKIYDRQINKQGMSDRVVDECNPDAHLTMKDVSTLCWDDKKDEGDEKDWSHVKDNYIDVVLQKVIADHGRRLNKQPFQHESLLVDRKEKQLSQLEKRLAKKSYEREKQAARQPAYNLLAGGRGHRPVASVRPMQQGLDRPSRWIPAEHWQRQGMTAQEMTLPLDVVIPTNQPEKGNIVLKAGQKVLVLKSPKGVYMQLESGKIVAIKTAIKVKGKAEDSHDPNKMLKSLPAPPHLGAAKNHHQMAAALQPQKKLVKPFQLNRNARRPPPTPNLMQRFPRQPLPGNSTISNMTAPELGPVGGSSSNSSDEEHLIDRTKHDLTINNDSVGMHMPDEIQKRISMLKKQVSIKRLPAAAASSAVSSSAVRQESTKSASVLQQLEETATSVVGENAPFQDTLDSITNSYQDDHLPDDTDTSTVTSYGDGNPKASHVSSDASEHSDDVTYVSEQPSSAQQQQPQTYPTNNEIKTETGGDFYNTNFYNYNNIQPYQQVAPVHQAPPQTYVYAQPPQPPGYEMMGGYAAPQQPQYNYGYQGYGQPPPPPPHYAIPPQGAAYEYHTAPVPPQPVQTVYQPYHNPYPQQYPPPPPQTMYQAVAQPAAATAIPQNVQNYQDYQQQYNNPQQQTNATPYYPNT